MWTRTQRLNIIIIVSNFFRSRFEKFASLDWARNRVESWRNEGNNNLLFVRSGATLLLAAETFVPVLRNVYFCEIRVDEETSQSHRQSKLIFWRISLRRRCATQHSPSSTRSASTWFVLTEATKYKARSCQRKTQRSHQNRFPGTTLLNLSGRLNCVLFNDDDRSTRSLSFLRLRKQSLNLTTQVARNDIARQLSSRFFGKSAE